MKRIRYYIILIPILTACLSPRYKVNENGFKSNRELWGLTLSELKVDSINQKGFPAKYAVLREFDARQIGDYKYDDTIKDIIWNPKKKSHSTKKSTTIAGLIHPNLKKWKRCPLLFFKMATGIFWQIGNQLLREEESIIYLCMSMKKENLKNTLTFRQDPGN